MSKADLVRTYALELVGKPYKWGEEFWYVVGAEQTKINDGDCSGMPYAVWRRAGVRVDGKPLPTTWRWRADDLYKKAKRISQPSKVGDLGFLLRGGECDHTFMYVGNGQVVEAGDGSGKVGLNTVAYQNRRGTVWGRLNTDIGELEGEYEVNLTEQQLNALIDKRIGEKIEVLTTIPDQLKAAQAHLQSRELLSQPRPTSKAASIGYVDLMLARALKLLGK